MATSQKSPITDFSRDVLGRYVSNGFDEADASTVIGGGTFGAALAEHLWVRGAGRGHRIGA